MVLSTKIISPEDDMTAICEQMQPDLWGKDNEMTSYQEAALRKYLEDDKHILLLAYEGEKVAGAALCYELPHPDGKQHSLYVHELDTHPDHRSQGVSTSLMQELFKIAHERSLQEVWLGTETDNDVANAFYRNLKPTAIEPSIIYAWTVSDKDVK